jgi:hypothetical protein
MPFLKAAFVTERGRQYEDIKSLGGREGEGLMDCGEFVQSGEAEVVDVKPPAAQFYLETGCLNVYLFCIESVFFCKFVLLGAQINFQPSLIAKSPVVR